MVSKYSKSCLPTQWFLFDDGGITVTFLEDSPRQVLFRASFSGGDQNSALFVTMSNCNSWGTIISRCWCRWIWRWLWRGK